MNWLSIATIARSDLDCIHITSLTGFQGVCTSFNRGVSAPEERYMRQFKALVPAVALLAGIMTSAARAVPVVSQLDGPEDLDLSLVQYALQFRSSTTGAAGPISGVNFDVVAGLPHPSGVTATGTSTFDDIGLNYEFGASADHDALETIADAGWVATLHPDLGPLPVNVGLALSSGTYKLQLIMVGTFPASPERLGNYTIEGTTTTVSTPGNYSGEAGPDYTSLVTDTVAVTDGTLDLSIVWTGDSGTNAPFLSGIIVNAVPEPTGVSLLAVGAAALLWRRARA
jgi:hypothetical protein